MVQRVWGGAQQARLRGIVEIPDRVFRLSDLAREKEWLRDVEVVFSTWGMPKLEEEHLALMPRLKAVFYAAGSVKGFAQPLLERGIQVFSAWVANALPVAEFTLAQILLSLKLTWPHARRMWQTPGPESWKWLDMPGNYGSTVGIVSLGMIGRKVCEFLIPFNLKKLAYDPVATPEVFEQFNTESVSLEDLFVRSDVVTVHAPWLAETEGLITGKLLASMRPNATFINTARGAVVNEEEMFEVLGSRPDITAILDVTVQEPPPEGSPFYYLPNIVLTPHIAGSGGNEVHRMADWMIDEFVAWDQEGVPKYEVTLSSLERMA